MIPIQITIEGFLCYRQKQVIDLTGMDLCMLSGPNGSGKSSVFDAVTMALFNTHRAGSRGREDLINKKCDIAVIELDFELEGQRFQARRTVSRRGSGTQVMRRWSDLKSTWESLPDTNSSKGYAEWVRAHVGLTADTFTSSMLLRQGKADRLLTAEPRERFELLSAVVGLEQYKLLHEKAIVGRRERKGQLEELSVQLQTMPEVCDEQITESHARAETAKAAVATANAEVERLQPLLEQAKRWEELHMDVESSQVELQKLQELLSRAPMIERDIARLRELEAVLPKLRDLLETRSSREKGVAKLKELTTRQDHSTAVHATSLKEIAAARSAQTAAATAAQQHLDQERVISARVAELKAILQQAEATERQQKELTERRKEIAKLSTAPDQDLQKVRDELQRLTDLEAASFWLNQLADHRRSIRDAQQPLREQRQVAEEVKAELARVAADLATSAKQYVAAEVSHSQAQAEDAQANADLKNARAALKALSEANGQAACPTCGHDLTPEHLAEEKSLREAAEKIAMQGRANAAKSLQSAAAELNRLRQVCADLEKRRTQFDKRFQDAMREGRILSDDVQKAVKQVASAYRALSPEYRDRVGTITPEAESAPATWIATAWPEAQDLSRIKADVSRLPDIKQAADAAEKTCNTWRTIKTQIEMLEKALIDRDAIADVESLRTEYATRTLEQTAVQQAITADRALGSKQKQDLERLQANVDAVVSELANLGRDIASESAHVRAHENAIRRCRSELGDAWVSMNIDSPLVDGIGLELKQLKESGAEQVERQLQEAKKQSDVKLQTLEKLREYINAIPIDARQQPEVIQVRLDKVRTERDTLQQISQDAQTARCKLQDARKTREAADARFKQLDREHKQHELLADLLGREGLQRHLIREAEKAIIKFANDILGPISSGDLFLRLRANSVDGDSDNALDLEAYHTRISNADSIPVPFLSGSQQFRVAVALALAIGQYTGGGNRLGECVIIDEGFGSLDSQGQEVMIEELQRLKGIMKRVILVSHQESFANAFPSGYRFSVEEGETRVSRISA